MNTSMNDFDFKRRESPLAIKQRAADGATGSGYISAFHTVDAAQEIVAPTAFDGSIESFLEDGFMALSHDWIEPVGVPTNAMVDHHGLLVEWRLADTQRGQDVRKLLAGGFIRKMSIGYRVEGYEDLAESDVHKYWGEHYYSPSQEDLKRARSGARLLTKINPLYEGSFVAVPANGAAIIRDAKDIASELNGFSRWLHREIGLSRTQCNRFVAAVKSVPNTSFSLLRRSESPDDATILRRARLAEQVKRDLDAAITQNAMATIAAVERSQRLYGPMLGKSARRASLSSASTPSKSTHTYTTRCEMQAENRRVLLPLMTDAQLRKMDPEVRISLFGSW